LHAGLALAQIGNQVLAKRAIKLTIIVKMHCKNVKPLFDRRIDKRKRIGARIGVHKTSYNFGDNAVWVHLHMFNIHFFAFLDLADKFNSWNDIIVHFKLIIFFLNFILSII